jgi:hypothetical protein
MDAGESAAPRVSRVPHAYERWTSAVLAGCALPDDPRTIARWAKGIGVSVSWLRAWCYAAGASPKASLDLTRVLRLVSQGDVPDPAHILNALDIVDVRTLGRLMARGGVARLFTPARRVSVDEVLQVQTYVAKADLVAHLRQRAPVLR